MNHPSNDIARRVLGILLLSIASIVSGQVAPASLDHYCVAQPDTTCFELNEGSVDTVGRNAYALGGTFRFCPGGDSADVAGIRVILVLDQSFSMCGNNRDPASCCAAGDSSGNCMMNDPNDKRIEAAHRFVDSLAERDPWSEVGVVAFDQQTVVNNPIPMTSVSNITIIHGWIYKASCMAHVGVNSINTPATTPVPASLGKTAATKATYVGLGLESALTAVDYNFAALPPHTSRHIILLTDGAWDDNDIHGPDTLIALYKAQYPGRPVPAVHGIFLSNVELHVAHGYPPEGCSVREPVVLDHLARVSSLTAGLYFPGTTPQTIVDNFQTGLLSIYRPDVKELRSLTITNTANGETRKGGPCSPVNDRASSWKTTLADLPLVSGNNALTFAWVVRSTVGGDSTVFNHITVVRSDADRDALATDRFKVLCTPVKVSKPCRLEPETIRSSIAGGSDERLNLLGRKVTVDRATQSPTGTISTGAYIHRNKRGNRERKNVVVK